MFVLDPTDFHYMDKKRQNLLGGYPINVFKSWLNYIVNISYLF